MPSLLRLASQSPGINAILNNAASAKWLAISTQTQGLTRAQRDQALSVTHITPTTQRRKACFYAPVFLIEDRYVMGTIMGPVFSPLHPPSAPAGIAPSATRFVLDLANLAILETRVYGAFGAIHVAHSGSRKEYALVPDTASGAPPQTPISVEVSYQQTTQTGQQQPVHLSTGPLPSWAQFTESYGQLFPIGNLLAQIRTTYSTNGNHGAPQNIISSSQQELIYLTPNDPTISEYGLPEVPEPLPPGIGRQTQTLRRLLPRPPR